MNSDKGAIGSAIHEIIHFVWFYVWNQTFADSYEEYETPSLKWILSEMIVESVMYQKQPIREFMKNSYAYCEEHEKEIRAHIQEAENHF